jgi:hypothetical protein
MGPNNPLTEVDRQGLHSGLARTRRLAKVGLTTG